MGLERPTLDDRTAAEFVDDARKLLPVRAPEWTDQNAHDPGVTVLETLAWLAETYLYQLDRVTDDHVRKYLQLLGTDIEPPRSASVRLRVDAADTAGDGPSLDGARLPAGEVVTAEDASGVPVPFETAAPVTLTDARVAAVVSSSRGGDSDDTRANAAEGVYFLAFGPEAERGSAMYVGFDGDPFAAADVFDLSVAFHDEGLPAPAAHGSEPSTFEPTVEVSWQYCTDYDAPRAPDSWTSLAVREGGADATAAERRHARLVSRLYRSGTVTLERPDDWRPDDWGAADASLFDRPAGLVWLRCVVGTPGYEIPPRLAAVRTNVVETRHRARADRTVLVSPDGGDLTTALPGQTFAFGRAPVLEATVGLAPPAEAADDAADADEHGGEGDEIRRWTPVHDFDASGPDDRHYVLDRAEGTVTFGDGIRGRLPEVGRRVVAEAYVFGGGRAGNVSRTAAWAFPDGRPLGTGVYAYYCRAHRDDGMKGAVVVDDGTGTGAEGAGEGDLYGGWFDDVDGVEGTADRRGESLVTVTVGEERPDGTFAFAPAAVRVDPGTTVRFEWATDGHDVVVADTPAGGAWGGHPTTEDAGYAFERVFDAVDLASLDVDAVSDATGGRDAESFDEALRRLRDDLRTPYRAVTLADHEYVATHTPGLRFGRAHALFDGGGRDEGGAERTGLAGTGTDECGKCEDGSDWDDWTPDVTRVVVVPYSTRPRPTPSDGFLRAVRHHLACHRLLTDRVSVEPPTYAGVRVSVEVRLDGGYAESGRTAAISDALDAYLDPLSGFDGDGWPFGRPLYPSDVYEVVEGVEGVDCVLDVSIGTNGDAWVTADGVVEGGATTLLYPESHDVVVRTERADCGAGGI